MNWIKNKVEARLKPRTTLGELIGYKFDGAMEYVFVPLAKRFLNEFRKGKIDRCNISNILVVDLYRGIGDAILFSPFLQTLQNSIPSARITIVVWPNPNVYELVKHFSSVDEVLIYDPKMRLKDKIKFIKTLREKHFDIAFDLAWYGDFTGILLTCGIGAMHTVGFDRAPRGLFFNHLCKVNGRIHTVEKGLALLESIGIPVGGKPTFEKFETINDRGFLSHFLQHNGINENDLVIGIHPGARDNIYILYKLWPADKYAALCDLLIEEYKVKVILFGDPEEKALSRKIASKMHHLPINMIGRTNVVELIILLRRCNLLVCNNSGLLHLAVAVGVPTVSVGGGVDPLQWGPYGNSEKHRTVLKNSHCKPYQCSTCKLKGTKCLSEISTESVFKAIQNILKGFNPK